jgi:hypothetical protein
MMDAIPFEVVVELLAGPVAVLPGIDIVLTPPPGIWITSPLDPRLTTSLFDKVTSCPPMDTV